MTISVMSLAIRLNHRYLHHLEPSATSSACSRRSHKLAQSTTYIDATLTYTEVQNLHSHRTAHACAPLGSITRRAATVRCLALHPPGVAATVLPAVYAAIAVIVSPRVVCLACCRIVVPFPLLGYCFARLMLPSPFFLPPGSRFEPRSPQLQHPVSKTGVHRDPVQDRGRDINVGGHEAGVPNSSRSSVDGKSGVE